MVISGRGKHDQAVLCRAAYGGDHVAGGRNRGGDRGRGEDCEIDVKRSGDHIGPPGNRDRFSRELDDLVYPGADLVSAVEGPVPAVQKSNKFKLGPAQTRTRVPQNFPRAWTR